MEVSIERALHERIGVQPRVRCVWLPPSCRVHLPDGSEIGVWLGVRGGEVEWRLDGMLAVADDIEAYLREVLDELGAPQVARCGMRVRMLRPDDRIECGLQNGGRAFAVANADGTLAIEILLDPNAVSARAEPLTIERSTELETMSRKLDGADEETGEDE